MEIILKLYEHYSREDGLEAWNKARPGFCEAESAAKACYLAKATGAKIGIVHVSSPETLDIIEYFRLKGLNVLAEACPQYLCLNHEDGRVFRPFTAKITPPVRSLKDNLSLWQGLGQGRFSIMGTDHCSNLLRRKLGSNIWETRPGFPGLETYLPILLSEGVNKDRISINQLVSLCCCGNARAFGLFPNKGVLCPGADADLVIVDLNMEKKVGNSNYQGFSDFSPYHGWNLKGWPVLTMVRGTVVMKNGEIIGRAGHAKYQAMKLKEV